MITRTDLAGYILCAFLVYLLSFGKAEQFVVWLDQGLNVLFGSGYADETLSSYFHRRADWRERVVNAIFFWQKGMTGKRNHCERAYMREFARMHMPKEMRP